MLTPVDARVDGCGRARTLTPNVHIFSTPLARRCALAAEPPSIRWRSAATLVTLERMTIFHLRRAYHDSLSNMRGWLLDTSFSERLTVLDRLSIIDAWQQEMVEFFTKNGYCFACNRRVSRCTCPTEQH